MGVLFDPATAPKQIQESIADVMQETDTAKWVQDKETGLVIIGTNPAMRHADLARIIHADHYDKGLLIKN